MKLVTSAVIFAFLCRTKTASIARTWNRSQTRSSDGRSLASHQASIVTHWMGKGRAIPRILPIPTPTRSSTHCRSYCSSCQQRHGRLSQGWGRTRCSSRNSRISALSPSPTNPPQSSSHSRALISFPQQLRSAAPVRHRPGPPQKSPGRPEPDNCRFPAWP